MWIRHCAHNIRLVTVELCILVHMVSCRAEGQTCGPYTEKKLARLSLVQHDLG